LISDSNKIILSVLMCFFLDIAFKIMRI